MGQTARARNYGPEPHSEKHGRGWHCAAKEAAAVYGRRFDARRSRETLARGMAGTKGAEAYA